MQVQSTLNAQHEATAPENDLQPPTTQPATIVRRVLIYYQTMTVPLSDLSIAYLVETWLQMQTITHLIISAFHLGKDGYLHLNDQTPDHDSFKDLWQNAQVLQKRGLKIMAMLGGACAGSYRCLDDDNAFPECYQTLHDMLVKYNFNGIDLDVEEPMSQKGITRLIDRLRADFGAEFIISLAPVATALQGGNHLSGFSYLVLERECGDKIDFYNAQFYNGWGTVETTHDYDRIVAMGFSPDRVVASLLTHSSNGTAGYINMDRLRLLVMELRFRYPHFGGVAGWEYFNSDPGGQDFPYQWSVFMARALGMIPELSGSVDDEVKGRSLER